MNKQKIASEKRKQNMGVGFAAMLIVLLFRIPLAGIIGDEGNGYLALGWEIYQLFFLIFAYSYTRIMASFIGSRMAKKMYRNSMTVARSVFVIGSFSLIAGAVLLFFFSNQIGSLIFQIPMVEISLKIFAPLLLVNGLLQIYRGFFEGIGTEVPTDISRLIEGIVIATGAFVGAYYAGQYGRKVGALLHNERFVYGFSSAGVVVSYVCGAVFSLFFMIFVYILYKMAFNRQLKKDNGRLAESKSSLYRAILTGAPLFVLEVAGVRLYRFVNLSLYVRRPSVEEGGDIIAEIGRFYGKITVLMALALVVILWFAGSGRSVQRKVLIRDQFKSGKQLLTEELKRLFSLALPVGVTYLVLGEFILKALYKGAGQSSIHMMRVAGISLIAISLGVYLYRTLQTLQLVRQLIVIQLIAFLVQTMAMAAFLRMPVFVQLSADISMGMAELIFWTVFSLGAAFVLRRTYRISLRLDQILVAPVVQTAMMLLIEIFIVGLLGSKLSPWLVCFLAILGGTLFYRFSGKISFLNPE